MAQWSGKSIGPLIGYKVFLLIIKILGIKSAYFLLHVVAGYYFWFKHSTRNNLIRFYQISLAATRQEARRLSRKNLTLFGQTLVDRAAFQLGMAKQYSYSFKNESYLLELTKAGNGGLLMSAHLGNWETAGNLLKERVSNKINVLMLDAEVEKIKRYMDKNTGGSHFTIIPIKNDLSHVIKIKNALSDNELVAIHADRMFEGAKFIEVEFFNTPVKFPYGPFLLASKLKAPITFVYAVKSATKSYALSATEPILGPKAPEEIAEAYVKELERMVTNHPEQWFNYYNYFEQ